MNNESEIIFRGPGPFPLLVAQSATADGDKDNGVTMILRGVLPGRGPQPESVSAQMLSSTARELAVRLMQAADKADGKPRQS